jgi:putative Holliday junction resolvase
MVRSDQASVLAIDYGEKRVGISLSHSISRLAMPLITLNNDASLFDALEKLIDENHVSNLVVGHPRDMNGQSTEQTLRIETFTNKLKSRFSLPIDLQDEALTSMQAEAELIARKKPYTKSDVDALAATYILSDWLSEHERIVDS